MIRLCGIIVALSFILGGTDLLNDNKRNCKIVGNECMGVYLVHNDVSLGRYELMYNGECLYLKEIAEDIGANLRDVLLDIMEKRFWELKDVRKISLKDKFGKPRMAWLLREECLKNIDEFKECLDYYTNIMIYPDEVIVFDDNIFKCDNHLKVFNEDKEDKLVVTSNGNCIIKEWNEINKCTYFNFNDERIFLECKDDLCHTINKEWFGNVVILINKEISKDKVLVLGNINCEGLYNLDKNEKYSIDKFIFNIEIKCGMSYCRMRDGKNKYVNYVLIRKCANRYKVVNEVDDYFMRKNVEIMGGDIIFIY